MKIPVSEAFFDQGELLQTLLLNRVKVGKFILAFSSRKSLMFQRVWKVVWDIYLLKLDISSNKFVPQNLLPTANNQLLSLKNVGALRPSKK